jgi:DNA-binding transcriptional LysR family regulator
MTLEQLRIFVAVAEREHVTQAARALNLTPSAVSAAIAALEARHAARLFDRVGRRIELTEAGRMFLSEARAVLARARAAETMLSDLTGLKRGTLVLAASQTAGNYWLPPLMQRYRAKFPGIKLHLTIGNTEEVAAMIRDGTADLGFIEGIAGGDPDLVARPVADDDLILVVGTRLAPAGKTAATASILKSLPWVFRESGSGTRALFEAALRKLGIRASDLEIVMELPSNEAVRCAVEANAGAAVLSRLVVSASLASGTLRMLPLALPKRQFFSLVHRQRYLSEAGRAFCGLAEPGIIALTPASRRSRR